MTANTLTPTFCRICEPLCPLVAETDGAGTVVALHPDHDHPVSAGSRATRAPRSTSSSLSGLLVVRDFSVDL